LALAIIGCESRKGILLRVESVGVGVGIGTITTAAAA
jgi:hypothetical protein